MNYRFQILILVLMLWSLGANYAMNWSMHDRNKKEPECNRNNFIETLPRTTAQLIDNFDPEDRTKIQLAALVASGPEIGISIFEAVAATRLLRQSKFADRAYKSNSKD